MPNAEVLISGRKDRPGAGQPLPRRDHDAEMERSVHERSIESVLIRYFRALDSRDRSAMLSAFQPHATIYEATFWHSPVEHTDLALEELTGRYDSSTTFVSNIAFDWEDGVVTVESYIQSMHVQSSGTNPVLDLFGGRCIDLFEHTGDGWKVTTRTMVHEWTDSKRCATVTAWIGRHEEGITCDVSVAEFLPTQTSSDSVPSWKGCI